MKTIRLWGVYALLCSLCLTVGCGGDDNGDDPTNNNHLTINGERFSIASITVNERDDFTSIPSWQVILADASYAPHVNNNDYEGAGHGIIIDYISENDPIEIDTENEFVSDYHLRLTAYDNGDIHQTRSNNPNTNGLTISVSGNEVTIEGDGVDEDDSSQTFSFFYQGASSIFN